MARTEKTSVYYETSLCDGIREAYGDNGELSGGEDEPFRIVLNKVTKIRVFDGRGENHSANKVSTEVIAELTLEQANGLVTHLVGDVTFAAKLGEQRVLRTNAKDQVSA